MPDSFENYITKNIRRVCKQRLIAPTLYSAFLILIWFVFGLHAILFPSNITKNKDLQSLYQQNTKYVKAEFKTLYFTGYTQKLFGSTTGYYYYAKWQKQVLIVLVSPDKSQEGLSQLKNVHLNARILPGTDSLAYQSLLQNLSNDLDWTASGIHGQISSYYLSQPDSHLILSGLFLFCYFFSGIYAVISILKFLFYIRFPHHATACRQLKSFGKPKELLALAEEELATLPQLATEDMFITEHFFIEISKYGIAIVPISEIIWIYKHSTLNKIFWYHFNISYTLHITANKHLYIQCPKNMKSDIDGIIDYLAEANHNILVGFNEENRLQVQKIQGTLFQLERLLAFLKKRI